MIMSSTLDDIRKKAFEKLEQAINQGQQTHVSGSAKLSYNRMLFSKDSTYPSYIITDLYEKCKANKISLSEFEDSIDEITSSFYYDNLYYFSITTPYEQLSEILYHYPCRVSIFDRRATMRSDPQKWLLLLESFHNLHPSAKNEIKESMSKYKLFESNESEFMSYATLLEQLYNLGVDGILLEKSSRMGSGDTIYVKGTNHYTILFMFILIVYLYITRKTFSSFSSLTDATIMSKLSKFHVSDSTTVRVDSSISEIFGLSDNGIFRQENEGIVVDQNKLEPLFHLAVEQLKLSKVEVAKLHLLADKDINSFISYIDSLKNRDLSFSDDAL